MDQDAPLLHLWKAKVLTRLTFERQARSGASERPERPRRHPTNGPCPFAGNITTNSTSPMNCCGGRARELIRLALRWLCMKQVRTTRSRTVFYGPTPRCYAHEGELNMPAAFKMYRIICTITDKALVSGSDCPHHHLGSQWRTPQWYMRGTWSKSSGAFWRGQDTVRKHIQNLCHDFDRQWGPSGHHNDTWLAPIPNSLDWSRLKDLRVEQIYITDYSTTQILASDFMGVAVEVAA